MLALLLVCAAAPADASGHPNRTYVRYRVHPGDTATGIATRFHAWTAELIAINHLRHGTLYAGSVIVVPVVTSRAHLPTRRPHHATHASSSLLYHPSRAQVGRALRSTARHFHVHPALAQAVAWQESGWQQDVRSSAGAIGVMQVMPQTGYWIGTVLGRRLHLGQMPDNVTAGVALLHLLREQTGPHRTVAAYYQGLGALRQHGMYRDTKRYVNNVEHLREAFVHGWNPAG